MKESRPQSAIYHININQNNNTMNNISSKSIQKRQKQKQSQKKCLINLIPDMPAIRPQKSLSSTLLYSKFIMKGIKTNKIDLVKQSFNMKKQILNHQKKLALSTIKTTHQNNNSTRPSLNKQKQLLLSNDKGQNLFSCRKITSSEYQNNTHCQLDNFFYNKTPEKTAKNLQKKTKNLDKSVSQNIINRPKTALRPTSSLKQKTAIRPITAKFTLSSQNQSKRKRAKTALHENKSSIKIKKEKDNKMFVEFQPFKAEKNILTIKNTDNYSNLGLTNHIQRNKRILSAMSKKSGVYLTGIDTGSDENVDKSKISFVQNLLRTQNIPFKKKTQQQKNNRLQVVSFQRNPQNTLSIPEKQKIREKNKQNLNFMKKNMPEKFKQYCDFIIMQENSFTQKDRVLLSKNLDQVKQNYWSQSKINDEKDKMQEAVNYFEDFYTLCDDIQNQLQAKAKQRKQIHQEKSILTLLECQKLFELYRQKQTLNKKCKEDLFEQKQSQREKINKKFYSIIKDLSFFKIKSLELCLKLLNLDWHVVSFDQGTFLEENNSEIQQFFVILNGSVLKKTKVIDPNSGNKDQNSQNQTRIVENTLFDGQSFVITDQNNQNVSFIAAEQILLLKFSYQQYKKLFAQKQNIKQKINILKRVFCNNDEEVLSRSKFLEAVAFLLDTKTFQPKQIIYRKGQKSCQLMFIAKGKVIVADQCILKRPKKIEKDLKKKKKFHNSKQQNLRLQNFCISRMRRKNLKNYKILGQNQRELIFYYQNNRQQLTRGDVINWEGLETIYLDGKSQKWTQPELETKTNEQQLNFSLISDAEQTTIYFLDFQKIKKLPQQFKKIFITQKFQEIQKTHKKKKEKQKKTVVQWDYFKQQICNKIIQKKKETKKN